ncbi:hypothetical protein IWW45_006747 [Coemansia sp. RSA 485]|nr:hypothetical protein IWW45_006747 [Coemansia sp. RSA 485]
MRLNFFAEVFCHLCNRKERSGVQDTTKLWRRTIKRHLDSFRRAAGIGDPALQSATQVAVREAQQMITAYENNITQHLGDYIRRAVNCALGKSEWAKRLKETPKGTAHDELQRRFKDEALQPSREVKKAIELRNYKDVDLCERGQAVVEELAPVLDAFGDDYTFENNDRFRDIKKNPGKHMQSFYELSRYFERKNISDFTCFPVRTSFVPAHTTINRDILRSQIIAPVIGKDKTRKIKDDDLWNRVVNLHSKPFRTSGGKYFSNPVEKSRKKPADLPAVAKPSRIWNRDLVAVLNMRTILLSLRKGSGISKEFQRGNNDVLAAPKPRRGHSKKSVPVNLPAKRPVSNADEGCPVCKKQSKENKSSTQRRSDKGRERDI